MNTDDIHDRWQSVTNDGDEFLKFSEVANKRCTRPDLHAFLLLHELFPGHSDLISCAEHGEIWLDVEDEQVETLTDEQIIELCRCGVRHHADGGLYMFV